MSAKKISTIVGVALVGVAVIAANLWYARDTSPGVTVETIKARDLEAIVSASGKIQPKRLVNISAETPGRVVELAVNEGDRITRGQFLLQIDPKSLRTRVDSGTASLEAASASLDQTRQSAGARAEGPSPASSWAVAPASGRPATMCWRAARSTPRPPPRAPSTMIWITCNVRWACIS